ncbi:hypothetical protein VPH35_017220 [Triticum aestivum]
MEIIVVSQTKNMANLQCWCISNLPSLQTNLPSFLMGHIFISNLPSVLEQTTNWQPTKNVGAMCNVNTQKTLGISHPTADTTWTTWRCRICRIRETKIRDSDQINRRAAV